MVLKRCLKFKLTALGVTLSLAPLGVVTISTDYQKVTWPRRPRRGRTAQAEQMRAMVQDLAAYVEGGSGASLAVSRRKKGGLGKAKAVASASKA